MNIEQFLDKPEIKESIEQGNLDLAYTFIDVGDRTELTEWLYEHRILPLEYVEKVYSKMFDTAVTPSFIVIPNHISAIEHHAFYNCEFLESIVFEDDSRCISFDGSAFGQCDSLKQIIIPKSVQAIGAQCFTSCTQLKQITIPESVKVVGNFCFTSCNNLTYVRIDSTQCQLKPQTFYNVSSIQRIDYAGTMDQWKSFGIDILRTGTVHCKDGIV